LPSPASASRSRRRRESGCLGEMARAVLLGGPGQTGQHRQPFFMGERTRSWLLVYLARLTARSAADE
jgi:hypothetical protein